MAIDGHRSNFPNQIDTWQELRDLSPSEKASATRWQELKLLGSLSTSEQIEFNDLTTQLSSAILSPEIMNKILDGVVNLQTFFKNETEGYIETKQQEFDATLQKLSDKKNWSNVTTYQQWNMVTYNEETYMSMQDNNINHDPSETNSLWWRKVAGRGQQGIPGVGLSFQGNYNNSNTYSVGSAVYYNNSIYYCINSSVGNLPTNSTYWQIFLADSGIANQATEPNSPYEGMVWIDTSTTFNNIKYYNDLSWSNIGTIASKIAIIDNGNLITANNVEDALQELTTKINANKSIIDNLPKYSPASGTATAITVTTGYFDQTDKQSFTFIASANNNGSTTTINADGKGAKSLYKPNTTITPTLIAGKAYTVWYDATSLCFFIKASAEGTAVAGDVLAGTTFSNDNDTGISGTLALTGTATTSDVLANKTFYNINAKSKETGTIPSKGSQIYTPSQSVQTIAANQYLAGVQTISAVTFDASKVLNDTTIAEKQGTMPNKGSKIFTPTAQQQSETAGYYSSVTCNGITISAGDAIVHTDEGGLQNYENYYVKCSKRYTLNNAGVIRISYKITTNWASGTIYSRVYKNGAAFGIENSFTSNFQGTYRVFTADFACNIGDYFEIYAKGGLISPIGLKAAHATITVS